MCVCFFLFLECFTQATPPTVQKTLDSRHRADISDRMSRGEQTHFCQAGFAVNPHMQWMGDLKVVLWAFFALFKLSATTTDGSLGRLAFAACTKLHFPCPEKPIGCGSSEIITRVMRKHFISADTKHVVLAFSAQSPNRLLMVRMCRGERQG